MFDWGAVAALTSRLWDQSRVFLWAISTAALIAYFVAVVGAQFDPTTFKDLARSLGFLLPAGLALAVLAAFKTVHDRRKHRIRFIPQQQHCLVAVNKQSDGTYLTQIRAVFEILNLSDGLAYLPEVRVLRPRVGRAEFLEKRLSIRRPDDGRFGRYSVPPGAVSDGDLMILVRADLAGTKREVDLKFKVSDQDGRWHVARVPRARVITATAA